MPPAADTASYPAAAPAAGGRRRLIEAALRLGARKRSLHAVGLRELAREAGLNPNTFYRHFQDMEDLSRAIFDEFTADLRARLREVRRAARQPFEASRGTVGLAFDYALRHPDVFIVAVCELRGALPPVRRVLRRLVADLAAEMIEDLRAANLVPQLGDAGLYEIAPLIVQHVMYAALDCIEEPLQRGVLVEQAARCIDMLVAGALALQRQAEGGTPEGRS